MDFFQFLQNSKPDKDLQNHTDHTNISHKKKKKTNTKKNIIITNSKYDSIQKKVQFKDTKINNEIHSIYKNIKSGNLVRIIGVENSPLNSYKGYIGEIRNYKYGNEYALVFLHTISSSNTIIKFPLNHFFLID